MSRSRSSWVVVVCLALAACSSWGDDEADAARGSTGSSPGGGAATDPGAAGAAPGAASGTPESDSVLPVIPADHPRVYLNAANLARLKGTLAAQTPAATRFAQTVAAAVGGADVYAFEPWNAALLARLEEKPSYCTWAVGKVDAYVTEEEGRIAAGQRADVAGDSYLYVGEQIGNLALVYDWCFDQVSPAQRTRWIAYANQAVWNVWHPEEAKWGTASHPWSGWSVDNPVNNYYFSFLRATMLLGLGTRGENPQADGWIDLFRQEKILSQLVPVYAADLVGGGSREGTGYGTAMRELFRIYDIWKATTGENLASKTGHARASMPWLMHATVPTLDRLAPIGDHARDSTAALFDYHRDYLLALTALHPNDPMARVTKSYLESCSVKQMSQQFVRFSDFLYDAPALTTKPLGDLHTTYHAAGTGYVFARSSWAPDATWLELTAGPYTESHAHHDQGQLLLYKREWLAYDGNVDSASGIVQDEEVHNLVRLSRGGATVRMQEGAGPAKLRALRDDADLTHLAGDLAPAYPAGAGVARDEREIVFLKPNVVVVFDRVAGGAGQGALTKTWQLATPLAAQVTGTSALLQGTRSSLAVFPVLPAVAPSVATLSSVASDVRAGRLLTLTQTSTGTDYFLVVLSLDGTVTSVTPSNVAGQRGVSLVLAGGRGATVRFSEGGLGGSVELRNGAAITRTVTLDASVATLPEFVVP